MKRIASLLHPLLHTLLLILVAAACSNSNFDVDTSEIQLNQKWHRLDSAIQKMPNQNYNDFNTQMLAEYGSFYRLYIQRILNIGHVQDPTVELRLKQYLKDEYVLEMFQEIEQVYPIIPESFQYKLKSGFKHYAYHFPDAFIPDVVFLATNFNYNIVAADSMLGIGLEFYLGSEHPVYEKMGLQQYRIDNARPDLMAYDALRGWALSEFQGSVDGDELLSVMIEYGKVLYLMDACFPNSSDALKIGYSEGELEWAIENEWEVWSKMLEKEVLYSDNGETIRRYTGEGPFTGGFPHESPSQLGYWVGWQIVRAYMNEHPESTLQELMQLKNAQELLRKSGYKPEK